MHIEHIAVWTKDLEQLKTFYMTYFGATANDKYVNSTKQFESYFLSFSSGARLELMAMPSIPDSLNNSECQFTPTGASVGEISSATIPIQRERMKDTEITA